MVVKAILNVLGRGLAVWMHSWKQQSVAPYWKNYPLPVHEVIRLGHKA